MLTTCQPSRASRTSTPWPTRAALFLPLNHGLPSHASSRLLIIPSGPNPSVQTLLDQPALFYIPHALSKANSTHISSGHVADSSPHHSPRCLIARSEGQCAPAWSAQSCCPRMYVDNARPVCPTPSWLLRPLFSLMLLFFPSHGSASRKKGAPTAKNTSTSRAPRKPSKRARRPSLKGSSPWPTRAAPGSPSGSESTAT